MTAILIKSSPVDIETFRQETSVKYPTFIPVQYPTPLADIAPSKPVPITSKLAQAYSPIPVRHHYHHDDTDTSLSGPPSNAHGHPFPLQQQQGQQAQQPQGSFRPNPHPATPAPSPPPSPKPKKQQYQTDQNRPFLFPFSRIGSRGNGRLVPFAIDEADKLYNRHMYISLALWQMWRTREDCMTAESGLDHLPGSEGVFESSTITSDVSHSHCIIKDIQLSLAGSRERRAVTRHRITRCKNRRGRRCGSGSRDAHHQA